jgi:hypothetical protein
VRRTVTVSGRAKRARSSVEIPTALGLSIRYKAIELPELQGSLVALVLNAHDEAN